MVDEAELFTFSYPRAPGVVWPASSRPWPPWTGASPTRRRFLTTRFGGKTHACGIRRDLERAVDAALAATN